MRKFSFFVLVLSTLFLQAHTDHYKNYNKIEMEIFKDNEKIGESIFFFKKENNKFIVKNKTNFKVELLGVTIFSVNSKSTEEYIGDQLISFNSETFQNDKKKFVNLIFDKKKINLLLMDHHFKVRLVKKI